MENGKVRDFVETMGYNDNILKYMDKYYLFTGFQYDENSKTYSFCVYEVMNKGYGNIVKTIFEDKSDSSQNCIEKFLNAKIWDGKSFYEVEKDMIWID